MKLFLFVTFWLLSTINILNHTVSVRSYNAQKITSIISKSSQQSTIKFGAFGMYTDTMKIRLYGPEGAGWTGIVIPLGFNDLKWDTLDIKASEKDGYTLILGLLKRSYISRAMDLVHDEITLGKRLGITKFLVDDALCGNGIPSENITKERIDQIAGWIHNDKPAGLLFCAENSPKAIRHNPNWHSKVDVIMPYEYKSSTWGSLDSLKAFYQLIQGKGKLILPILGYHADVAPRLNPITFYQDQKGTKGGNEGFIELADEYSSFNMVFFYHYWRPDDPTYLTQFDSLTNYLDTYYDMGKLTK